MNAKTLRRSGLLAAAVLALPLSCLLRAQDADMPPPPPGADGGPGGAPDMAASTGNTSSSSSSTTATDGTQRRQRQQGQQSDRPRGNFNPEEMRARMLAALREAMGNPADAEWAIIAERVQKVSELRMSSMGMGMGMRGPGGPGGQGGQGRNRASSAEVESLQAAIKENAPAAEIKSRLERLREVRKANEEKLAKAQEDLRAVLDVKQEAVAVIYGLLP